MARGRNRRRNQRSYRREVGFFPAQNLQEDIVLVEEVETVEITRMEMINYFHVKVTFPELTNVSETAESYAVRGLQTVGHLGERVARELWNDDQLLSPQAAVDLFEDERLLAPETLLAQLLKESRRERRGDGVTLSFTCLIRGVWGGDFFED